MRYFEMTLVGDQLVKNTKHLVGETKYKLTRTGLAGTRRRSKQEEEDPVYLNFKFPTTPLFVKLYPQWVHPKPSLF